MTLQNNAHPRLKDIFENGARRADYDAAIALMFEVMHPHAAASVADFFIFAEMLDLPGLDYKQMARVLKQKADKGELLVTTVHGTYRYSLPEDGVNPAWRV